MDYTILNKKNQKRLMYRKATVWTTPHLKEAVDMLKDFKEYLKAVHLESLQDDFVVIEVESGNEVGYIM